MTEPTVPPPSHILPLTDIWTDFCAVLIAREKETPPNRPLPFVVWRTPRPLSPAEVVECLLFPLPGRFVENHVEYDAQSQELIIPLVARAPLSESTRDAMTFAAQILPER